MEESRDARINQVLRQAREARGWSQEDVAGRLGTNPFTVYRWESGRAFPSPYFRQKLCQLFESDAATLGLIPDRESLSSHYEKDQQPFVPHKCSNSSARIIPLLTPTPPQVFLGRADLLSTLKERFLTKERAPLLALSGLPGMGKTAIALTLAHDPKVQACFPDGILWAGLGRTPQILEILSQWGSLLGLTTAEAARLQQIEAWARTLRALIGQKRLLLILDDAWQIEDALACQVGGTNCVHMLTTRFPDLAFQFAGEESLSVTDLEEKDSLELLASWAPSVVTAESEAARGLVQAVGGLPLGLVLLGKYLARQSASGQPRRLQAALQALQLRARRLQLPLPQVPADAHSSLPAAIPLSLQTSIGMSVDALPPEAQAALRDLAIFPPKPGSFLEEAALAVSGASLETLDILLDRGLIESAGAKRYRLHQTIADYAQLSDRPQETDLRLVRWATEWISKHEKEYTVIEPEMDTILTALQIARKQREFILLLQGSNAFVSFLIVRGFYKLAERLLEQAHKDRDMYPLSLLAITCSNLGKVKERLGEYIEAERYLQEGLALARQCHNHVILMDLLITTGELTIHTGNYREGERYAQEGLALAKQEHHLENLCAFLRLAGTIALQRGDPVRAQEYLQEGLILSKQNGYLPGGFLHILGIQAIQSGNLTQAQAYWLENLEFARQVGSREIISTQLLNLGALEADLGNGEKAQQYWEESLSLAREIDLKQNILYLLLNLGEQAGMHGDEHLAEHYLQEGLALARQIGNREGLCRLLKVSGELALYQDDTEQAERCISEGLALARERELSILSCDLLTAAGKLAIKREEFQQAATCLQEGLMLARQHQDSQQISTCLSLQGWIFFLQHNLEKAAEYLREALSSAPHGDQLVKATALYYLAQVTLAQEQANEALHNAQESLALFEELEHYQAKTVREWLALSFAI